MSRLLTLLRRKGSIDPLDPDDVTGLQLWLDAADETTLTLDDTAVTQWDNKGTIASNAAQATADDQPTYTTLGGRPVVSFADDLMIMSGLNSLWDYFHAGQYHTFAVVKFGNDSNPGNIRGLMGNNRHSAVRRGHSVVLDDRRFGGPENAIMHAVYDATSTDGTTMVSNTGANESFPANELALLHVVGDPANVTAALRSAIRRNRGTVIANNADTGTASASSAADSLQIGATGGTGTNRLLGQIGEIASYNRLLTAEEVAGLAAGFAAKWGLVL